MISFHVYLLNEIIKRDKKYYLIFKTSTGEKIEFLHPIPFISLKENLNDKKYNELLKYFVS
ncbi:hypothetical protein K9M42_03420 [Patescibacteria group bacterium]|nr:hypothetical protein [Patescibacteria group bacterium]